MNTNPELEIIEQKLALLIASFKTVLYEKDKTFLTNMQKKKVANDETHKYMHWEWTQGVGLYGLWKLFEKTKNQDYLRLITDYYDGQIANGLPSKNINTTAPLLTLSYLYEYTDNQVYRDVCVEWAQWIITGLPRTSQRGFQHITSDSVNEQELWDDTLFMTVLFLANIGRILKNGEYIQEATYQFLLHTQYLADRKTGLWYHGWTFNGYHNFSGAFWGRGNCWITIAIPTFLDMIHPSAAVAGFLKSVLEKQVASLADLQDAEGMWHTLLDDPTSYVEASATCGFSYGILLAIHQGLINPAYRKCALRAFEPILDCIDGTGIVHQVSYGTAMGRNTKDFYKNIPIQSMPYGQAIAILFLIEMMTDIRDGPIPLRGNGPPA